MCVRERAKANPLDERHRRLSSLGSDLTTSSNGFSARFASLKRGLRVFPYDAVRRYYFSLFVRDENGCVEFAIDALSRPSYVNTFQLFLDFEISKIPSK